MRTKLQIALDSLESLKLSTGYSRQRIHNWHKSGNVPAHAKAKFKELNPELDEGFWETHNKSVEIESSELDEIAGLLATPGARVTFTQLGNGKWRMEQ